MKGTIRQAPPYFANGQIQGVGAHFGHAPGTEVLVFGYWVVPLTLALGLAILVGTQRASRRVLAWLRSRRPPARLRVRVEVERRQA